MENLEKILIVRFSSIGDIVLTTPIVRCLRAKYPTAEIHYLTKQTFLSLIENNPYISKCWTIEKDLTEVIQDLKNEKFNLIVDLHKNLRTKVLKQKLGVKSLTFDKLNFKKWLLTKFKINLLPNKHLVDRYFEALSPLNLTNDYKGLDFFIPASEFKNIRDIVPELDEKFVVLVCGAAHATKALSLEKSLEIIANIQQPIVLIGGKNEVNFGIKLLELSGKNKLYNLCGKLSINASASIIQQSEVVITPDTGMMHIAAALNKKIISVWGNTVPEFGMYPYFPNRTKQFKIAEVKNLPCRPCSKIGYETCPKKHFNCIQQINAQEITTWVEEYV